jgi:Domain of unknown function (DUF4156)
MLMKSRLLVVSLLLPGCFSNVVALEPKAEAVKIVHESDKPLRCDVKGKISGTSRSSDKKAAETGAQNDFRNHAAELKANYAFAEAQRSGPVGTSDQQDVFIGGKALLCQTEAMEEAADKAAAAASEQKEKEADEQKQKEDEEKKAAKEKKKAKK